MSTELTEIEGIGPSYAETLEDDGYESAEDVAEADPDEIDGVIDAKDGQDVVGAARALVETEDSGNSEDDEPQTFEVDMDFDVDQEHHLIGALVNEEVKARRTNSAEDRDAMTDMIEQVREGSPYEFTMYQLNAGFRAVNQLEAEYRSTRGLGSFVTKVRDMRDQFKDVREEYWDE